MRQLRRAWNEARRVLADEGVVTSRVNVRKIAERYAVVLERTMDSEISGMLIPLDEATHGRKWAIVVNKAHPGTRQRFTIAHELGHLLLHGYRTTHADRRLRVRFRDSRSSDGSVTEEIEANQFAAELLMPRDQVLRRVEECGLEYAPSGDDDDGTQVVALLAKEFDVSVPALSVRLASLFA